MSGQALVMPTNRCPARTCGGTHIHRHPASSPLAQRIASTWGNKVACPIDQCLSCSAIWEPWPEGTSIDCVERGQCDNCAYRAGSKESSNKAEWANLVACAENAAEWSDVPEATVRWFSCHEGIPIVIDKMNDTLKFDFHAAGIGQMEQTCRGFLNVMWAIRAKKNKKSTIPSTEETVL